jgi:hypothetical protein
VQFLRFWAHQRQARSCAIQEAYQLLRAIHAIFQSREKATLERMFREWMDRLAQCCVAVDDLVEGA